LTQALVAKPTVEARDVAVLHRPTRIDEVEIDAALTTRSDEFGPLSTVIASGLPERTSSCRTDGIGE